MSSLIHNFHGNPFTDYLPDLAQKLGVEANPDMINFPPHIGSGYVKNIILEENFCVRYFNISFKKDFEFEYFVEHHEPEIFYNLVYLLDSKENGAQAENENHVSSANILLYSNDFVRKGIIKKNTALRRIAIIFNATWLNNNYAEASIKMDGLIHSLITKNKSTVLSENLDIQNRFIATQLANELDRNVFVQIHVKTASFILLNDFLNKIVQRNRQDILSDQSFHYYTMIKVEEKIMHSLNQKLPNLDQLAAEFNLSLSTLKRHFRIVFGKNIYQYYQEKRMEWGKTQLEKGDCTIGEIATHLGFYKINNFSIAFKKYFGVLPRELKHKTFIHINN